MRGLLKAALFAPVLAAALALPDVDVAEDELTNLEATEVWGGEAVADHSFALIAVEVPNISDDEANHPLAFRLDIFPSKEECGYGNVTIDDQALPQTLVGDVLAGEGSISSDYGSIAASWSIQCVKVDGEPVYQVLKFVVDAIDGQAMEGVGFVALFTQTGSTEIMYIETDLSLSDYVVADINDDFSIEDEIDELEWMRAQLKELEYLIREKEQAIAEYDTSDAEDEIGDCDSLTCLIKVVVDKAWNAAHKAFSEVHDHAAQDFGHFPKPPFKKPHWPTIPSKPGKGKHGDGKPGKGKPGKGRHGKGKPCKGKPEKGHPGEGQHGKPGNHTRGPPKHGNHTHPPHHKKPHFPHHRLPICHYPPPHHGPPHHKPPHHKPPHGKPPHGKPPHGKPPHGKPPYVKPPHHDNTPPSERPSQPHDGNQPSTSGHQRPSHDEDHSIPGRPGNRPESHFNGLADHGPPGPPGPQAPFNGFHNSQRNGLFKALHILKFAVIGFLVAFIVVALHRRTCNPKKRVARLARREERRQRRALRRAVYKQTIANLFARFSGHGSDESDDCEGKRQALLASAEDGMSVTMTEEITQFRNAADVVEDMVAAEAGRVQTQIRAQPMPLPASESRPLMRDFDIGSQAGDAEDLPAYEDDDRSEMSSMVADGFRYTPGSSEYSPSHSLAGSVSDILGLDAKQ